MREEEVGSLPEDYWSLGPKPDCGIALRDILRNATRVGGAGGVFPSPSILLNLRLSVVPPERRLAYPDHSFSFLSFLFLSS